MNIGKNLSEAKKDIVTKLQEAKSKNKKKPQSQLRRGKKRKSSGGKWKHPYNPTNKREKYDITNNDTDTD